MKRKPLIVTILIILFIIICLLIYYIFINQNIEDETIRNVQTNTPEVNIQDEKVEADRVTSASAYFTVQSCINKYLTYVSTQDTDSLLKLLDNEYISEHNITENNVLNNVENITVNCTFEAKEMYQHKINDDNITYYALGTLREEGLVIGDIIDEKYTIAITLDYNNMIYSVIPFEDGGLFDE